MANEIPNYVTVNVQTLSEKVSEYVSEMETQRTNEWCRCEWVIHPDDVNLDVHNCANCHHPSLVHMSGDDSYCTYEDMDHLFIDGKCKCEQYVNPPKRRLRRGDTNPECPVHTKEGFLIGFFNWMYKKGEFSGE